MHIPILTAIALALAVFAITPAAAQDACTAKQTPLHIAIDAGDYDKAVKQIKARGGRYVNVIAQYNFDDESLRYCEAPLHRALWREDGAEITKVLLAAGADVNVKGGWDNNTPLHTAARNGHTEIATALIAKSAEVNVKSYDGQTPLNSAKFAEF